jgi:hypothetical protein
MQGDRWQQGHECMMPALLAGEAHLLLVGEVQLLLAGR